MDASISVSRYNVLVKFGAEVDEWDCQTVKRFLLIEDVKNTCQAIKAEESVAQAKADRDLKR